MTIRKPIAKAFTIGSKTEAPLSAILMKPRGARTCFVFAHGAGAGMSHPFMEQIAAGLYGRGVATLCYQFPFMEKGSKRPDQPAIAHAAIRAAVAEARKRCRGVALVAGGKSFGGRMTSQAQAIEPLEGVLGLAFLGFPLHPSGKPSIARAQHLVLHDLKTLSVDPAARGIDVVIFGNSHVPKIETVRGVLYLDPGSRTPAFQTAYCAGDSRHHATACCRL